MTSRHRLTAFEGISHVTAEENERLTRVGPGTPMGEVMRRYWQPACLVAELPEPDDPPVRVRLLGEDLVAFRDSSGVVGLVGRVLRAPSGAAVLRPQRGVWSSLRVPRLEVRRHRPLRGSPVRAGVLPHA